MNDDKDYIKNIVHERTTKSFTIDMNTLGMVKDYQEKYYRSNFSQAIDDLVNIGLANLGYKTQEDIDARFKGTDVDRSPIDVSKYLDILKEKNIDLSEYLDIFKEKNDDFIAIGISHSQHERMRSIIDLIKRLCNESPDGSAARSDIISEYQ